MNIQLLSLPYDSGVPDVRLGLGPRRIMEAGLKGHLEASGHVARHQVIEMTGQPLEPEPHAAIQLNRALAESVSSAARDGWFPVVLAGNCYSAVGTVAGLGPQRTGVAWFDSHGDFNTPETTVTGFLDGMALAIVTGRCWGELVTRVTGFEPVPERHVCLLGARDLDPLEADLLERCEITFHGPAQVRSGVESSLRHLSERVDQVYVHVDLDVLDPSEGRANWLAAPDGLTLAEVQGAIRAIGSLSSIGGLALTAYDPSFDENGAVCRAAFELIDTVLEVVTADQDGPG